MRKRAFIPVLVCVLTLVAELHAQSGLTGDVPDRAATRKMEPRSFRLDAPGHYGEPIFARANNGSVFQDENAAEEPDPATAPAAEPTPAPASQGLDDIWTRDKLTGDWFGLRSDLANHGINFDLRLIQYYQGVAYGGASTNFDYGGRLDSLLKIDGGKLFNLQGLFVTMRTRTQFGHSINGDAGGFALPNTTMLLPLPDQHKTAITGLLVEQELSKNLVLAAGKIDVLDFWTMVYPRMGGGADGFSNLNFLAAAMPWLRFVNLAVNGGGPLVLTDDGQIRGGVLVFDLNNSTTTVGLSNLFDDGAGFLGVWRFFFDVYDKPGRLLFAFGGATRAYGVIEETDSGLFGIDGRRGNSGFGVEKETGAWTTAIYYDQVLWRDPENHKRDLWFWTGFSISDGNPSFGKWDGFASLEAAGMLFGREKDKVGVAAFYNGMSSSFKTETDLLGVASRDMWGAEIYYNAEITPWFHLTADLQVVQNEIEDDEPAIILGLRGVMDF